MPLFEHLGMNRSLCWSDKPFGCLGFLGRHSYILTMQTEKPRIAEKYCNTGLLFIVQIVCHL